MKLSLVSVIIPTYQGSQVVKRAIDSVLMQSYPNIEVIVVDDNNPLSKERVRTEAVMKGYEDNNKVLYIKHFQNKNGSAARNTGIRASHGDFVAFLDDDDWFLPKKIEKQIFYLNEHNEYAACYCFAQRDGSAIKAYPYKGDVTKDLLLMRPRMFTPSLFFRKEAILAINGFDESFRRHQDYEMLLRFFKTGYLIGCVEEVLIELGWGGANNVPSPERILELKKQFLTSFADSIDEVEREEPGFRKKALALHYGSVFQIFLFKHYYSKALKIAFQYFFYAPSYFLSPIRRVLKDALSSKCKNLLGKQPKLIG